MKDQKELFIVEHENGEWVDHTGEGGWSCWTTLAEAQDALNSEADNYEVSEVEFRIVRFVREPAHMGEGTEKQKIADLLNVPVEQVHKLDWKSYEESEMNKRYIVIAYDATSVIVSRISAEMDFQVCPASKQVNLLYQGSDFLAALNALQVAHSTDIDR
jgi:hypothetical protein